MTFERFNELYEAFGVWMDDRLEGIQAINKLNPQADEVIFCIGKAVPLNLSEAILSDLAII